MTPEDLARRHPKLFHATAPGGADAIMRHGLLSTLQLLDLFEADHATRRSVTARRPRCVTLHHRLHGSATITDNSPLHMASLVRCLDGMTPHEWLHALNERVFFWVSEVRLAALANSAANRVRGMDVLILDTLGVARSTIGRIDLCPFNAGATVRRPPRRGRDTFTPLERYGYPEWSRLRTGKMPDTICEVTIRGGLVPVGPHVIDIRRAASP